MRTATLKDRLFRAAVVARHPELAFGRGLSMLEYALMALIVLTIFGAMSIFFRGFFDDLITKMKGLFGAGGI